LGERGKGVRGFVLYTVVKYYAGHHLGSNGRAHRFKSSIDL